MITDNTNIPSGKFFSNYSLVECLNKKEVLNFLDTYLDKGKIDYIYEIKLENIRLLDYDLFEDEIDTLLDFFYDNDVIPNLEYESLNEDLDSDLGFFEEFE